MRRLVTSSVDSRLSVNRPKVTVLTPTFQRKDMLRLTLASVRLQNWSDVEHIVIDGGSTDGTVELLRAAESQWGVRWVSEPDSGMYEALNKGLAMASGAIVGWINSDDWLLPWTVQSAANHITSSQVPTAVYGDILSTEPGSDESLLRVYGAFNRVGLATIGTLAQPTVFWPLSATTDVGLLDVETFRQIADCDYWLRLSEVIDFQRCRELMAIQVNHTGTKRSSLTEEISEEFQRLRCAYRPAGKNLGWEHIKHAVRWRTELGRLLLGLDWPSARASHSIELPISSLSRSQALLQFGPQRRDPLSRMHVGVGKYVKQLEVTGQELGV